MRVCYLSSHTFLASSMCLLCRSTSWCVVLASKTGLGFPLGEKEVQLIPYVGLES